MQGATIKIWKLLFGCCIYTLDSPVCVIHMLLFPVRLLKRLYIKDDDIAHYIPFICRALTINTGLVKIMLTLLRTAVSSIPREMCVRALNGTVARWLLCVKHDGQQVETVL